MYKNRRPRPPPAPKPPKRAKTDLIDPALASQSSASDAPMDAAAAFQESTLTQFYQWAHNCNARTSKRYAFSFNRERHHPLKVLFDAMRKEPIAGMNLPFFTFATMISFLVAKYKHIVICASKSAKPIPVASFLADNHQSSAPLDPFPEHHLRMVFAHLSPTAQHPYVRYLPLVHPVAAECAAVETQTWPDQLMAIRMARNVTPRPLPFFVELDFHAYLAPFARPLPFNGALVHLLAYMDSITAAIATLMNTTNKNANPIFHVYAVAMAEIRDCHVVAGDISKKLDAYNVATMNNSKELMKAMTFHGDDLADCCLFISGYNSMLLIYQALLEMLFCDLRREAFALIHMAMQMRSIFLCNQPALEQAYTMPVLARVRPLLLHMLEWLTPMEMEVIGGDEYRKRINEWI